MNGYHKKQCLSFTNIQRIISVLTLTGVWMLTLLSLKPIPSHAAVSMPTTAALYFAPSNIQAGPKQTFTTALKIATGVNTVDSATMFVDFDPTYVQVLSITSSSTLSESGQGWDNATGELFYAAANVTGTISGTVALAEVTFQAHSTLVSDARLHYSLTAPRQTRVSAAGISLTLETQSTSIEISGTLVSLQSYSTTIQRGHPFTMNIQVATNAHPVNGAQAYVDFDPAYIQITNIENSGMFSTEITSTYSNTLGQATYAVESQNTTSGTFTLATLTFQAMTATVKPTTVTLHTYPPRETLLFSSPVTLTCAVAGRAVRITAVLPPPTFTLYLPLILRLHIPLAIPTNVKASALSPTEVQITWQDNSHNETGFTIYEGSHWITDVVANVITHTLSGLTPNAYYCFNVYAFNADGRSDWSEWGCVSMPKLPPPCTEIAVNGGFETDAAWRLPLTPYSAQYTTATIHTGSRALQTGIFSATFNVESYSSARQAITLPTDSISAHLHLWLQPHTTESITQRLNVTPPPRGVKLANWHPAAQTDAQYVVILDTDEQVLQTLLWTRHNTQTWTFHEFDLRAYAGQAIRVLVGTYNDGLEGVTGMYVDDVSVMVCGP